MYVINVKLHLKPEKRDQFIEEVMLDAKGSRANEPGNLRFDVFQDEADPNTICLYEVYRDQAAFDKHLTMPHFIQWRDKVKDWYAAPAERTRGFNILPTDDAWE